MGKTVSRDRKFSTTRSSTALAPAVPSTSDDKSRKRIREIAGLNSVFSIRPSFATALRARSAVATISASLWTASGS